MAINSILGGNSEPDDQGVEVDEEVMESRASINYDAKE